MNFLELNVGERIAYSNDSDVHLVELPSNHFPEEEFSISDMFAFQDFSKMQLGVNIYRIAEAYNRLTQSTIESKGIGLINITYIGNIHVHIIPKYPIRINDRLGVLSNFIPGPTLNNFVLGNYGTYEHDPHLSEQENNYMKELFKDSLKVFRMSAMLPNLRSYLDNACVRIDPWNVKLRIDEGGYHLVVTDLVQNITATAKNHWLD